MMARNTLLNIAGYGAPVLAAVIAIPLLMRGMGPDRFGVLTIIWLVMGYFSLFDLGLGNAATKLVAEKIGAQREHEVRALLRTSFVALLAWGLLGTVLLLLLTPWLVSSVLKIPLWLRAESIRTFYLLAFVIPFVALTASFRGVLEAYHRFDLVNSVRIPLGFITFFGPLLVLRFTADLFQVTAALVFVRALTLIIHGFQLHRIVSRVPGERTAWCDLRSLLAYGGWITISNIISPILASADRFLIGALVSVSTVAYYALPFEIATKLLILAGGLVGVLFPAFSATVMKDRQRTAKICLRGMLFLFVAMFPVVLIVIALAREGLALWLGREFADNSFRALQCLTAGVFINSFAQIASALVQSAGRPDLTAKAHLAELPLYLACLWLLITIFGVPGAALAWFLRVLADGVLVFLFASRLVPSMTQHVRKIFFLVFATIIAALAIAQMHPLPLKVISLAAALFLTGLAVWTRLVPGGDKARLREAFREVLHRIHQKSAVFGKQENE
jgi:O-antigen/teichoic acid export membrane protein